MLQADDALQYLIAALRGDAAPQLANYGYDIYVSNAVGRYFQDIGDAVQHGDQKFADAAPAFMNATWELCRMGILRPGVRGWHRQVTDEGSGGEGFSLTSNGRMWLAEPEHMEFIPTEPARFARLLEPYRGQFGDGFHERAQEAVRCYRAHAYLACCAMCGAAAEAILLAVAIEKSGDIDAVLSDYMSSGGRMRIENQIVGRADARLKRGFDGVVALLKYWRDISAHGATSDIDDHEAFVSLLLLLRHAAFVADNWNDLTGRNS